MKSYLVAGSAKGIGAAVVEALLQGGGRVTAFDVDAAGLERLAERHAGAALRVVAGSVTDPESCAAAVAAALDHGGRLDGLSFNAGIQRYGTVGDTPRETWDEVIAVNLTGAYLVCHAAIDALCESRGAIAIMGSVQSLATQRNVLAYTASKHGLLGLTRSIAIDYADRGVRCNMVAPGTVDTPMLAAAAEGAKDREAFDRTLAAMHPMGRIAQPEEIARLAVFLLSDAASFVTGEVIRADGGMLSAIAGTPADS